MTRCTYERHDGRFRHMWKRCGLDIVKDVLVRVRRCELCGQERYIKYR